MFIGGSQMKRPQSHTSILAALTVFIYAPCKADVPAPAAPPAPTGTYCISIYSELSTGMRAFNAQLVTAPTWTPVLGGPTLYAANLQVADSNAGPQISGPNYLPSVVAQLQEMKAMGVHAVAVAVLFPILYEPFYGSQASLQPYLTFYAPVAQAVRVPVALRRDNALARLWQAGFHNVTCSLENHLNACQFRPLCDGRARTVYITFNADRNGSGQHAAQCLAGHNAWQADSGKKAQTLVGFPYPKDTVRTASSSKATMPSNSNALWRTPAHDLSRDPVAQSE
jgi:hypothetical protein